MVYTLIGVRGKDASDVGPDSTFCWEIDPTTNGGNSAEDYKASLAKKFPNFKVIEDVKADSNCTGAFQKQWKGTYAAKRFAYP